MQEENTTQVEEVKEPVKLTVSGILGDLQNGYTKSPKDKHYAGEGKSLMEKYGLIRADITRLFKHEKLRGRKTIVAKAAKPLAFILTDDTEGDLAEETATFDTDDAPKEEDPIDSFDDKDSTEDDGGFTGQLDSEPQADTQTEDPAWA